MHLFSLDSSERILSLQFDGYWRSRFPIKIHSSDKVHVQRRESWECVYFEWHWLDSAAPTFRLSFSAQPFTPSKGTCLIACVQVESGIRYRIVFTDNGSDISIGDWQTGKGWRSEIVTPAPTHYFDTITLEVDGGSLHEDYSIGVHWLAWSETPAKTTVSNMTSDTLADMIRNPIELTASNPTHGFLFDQIELISLRKKRTSPSWKHQYEALRTKAKDAMARHPINEVLLYAPWGDDRFSRPHETRRPPFYHQGLCCGLIGLLEEDESLCRKAIEFLAAMLLTPNWKASNQCDVPGSGWDMRCFIEEQMLSACTILLDWFGEALEPGFLNFARRKLYDDGIAIIERDLAMHEYVHWMNQGIWFSRGRILGLLWLETAWPRLRARTDQAMQDCQTMLNNYIQPDGSVHEGIGYYGLTLEVVCGALYPYSRRRNKPLEELIPKSICNSQPYLEAMAMNQAGTFQPMGDNADERIYSDGFALLARLYPSSVFSRLASAVCKPPTRYSYFQHYVGYGVYAFIWGGEVIPESQSIQQPETHLPDLGIAVMSRSIASRLPLRAWLTGKPQKHSHCHDDAGNLLLTVQGIPVFVDRGVDRYESIHNRRLMRTRRHNCLTPTTLEGFDQSQIKPAPPCVVKIPKPYTASVDLTDAWGGTFEHYTRSIHLDSNGNLRLFDSGHLKESTPVSLHFHTPLKVTREPSCLMLTEETFQIRLKADWAGDFECTHDTLDCMNRKITHIRLIGHPVKSFNWSTLFEIIPLETCSKS